MMIYDQHHIVKLKSHGHASGKFDASYKRSTSAHVLLSDFIIRSLFH